MSSKKLAQRKRMFVANQHRLQVGEKYIPAPMPDPHEECPQGSREVKRRLEAGLQAEHERAENAAERAAGAADRQDNESDNPKKTRTYVRAQIKQDENVENVRTKRDILMQRGSHQYGLEVTLCCVLLLIIIIIKLFIIIIIIIIIIQYSYYSVMIIIIIQYSVSIIQSVQYYY